MAFNPKKARRWIAATAVVLLAVVLSFYAYGRYLVKREIAEIPKKLGVEISQSTEGFKFSKSERGRTLFTISAGKAVQFKQGQRASLENVRIVVFGGGTGRGERYDQIYGKSFAYDPESGEVSAQGEVHIDLQAQGKPPENPAEDVHAITKVVNTKDLNANELGSIHLKTSGLSFNQKTGIARTKERIEFSIPQANGAAVGAVYDSNQRVLTLDSNVQVKTAAQAGGLGLSSEAAEIRAAHAVITSEPVRAVLNDVRVEQQDRSMSADNVAIDLRPDNTIEKIAAEGNVLASARGRTNSTVRARQADFAFSKENSLRKAILKGDVRMNATGASPMNGSAGTVVIDFASKNAISMVQATEAVRFEQSSQAAQSNIQGKAMVQPATAFQSDAIDFFFGQDNQLKRAVTTGSSQIAMNSDDSKSRTVITAGRFEGTFASENRLEDLVGSPSVQVITKTQGQPDRVIISRQMSAHFDVTGGGKKGIARVTQSGDVKYTEGQRNATAERAVFLPAEDVLQLSGSPRVHDNEQGITIAAQALRLNRRTGEITGNQNVKTTYNQMKPNSGGAMLASAEPIHATAQIVNANRNTGIARYSGGARLWQGANMVQAPEIIFDRNQRSLTAIAGADRPVQTVFVQTDKLGKVAPVNVAAGRLSYFDHQRKVVLEQGVSVKTPDTSVRAGRVEITLKPKGNESAGMASQVEQVVAVAAEKDNLVIEQENPVRRAIGERLIYTAEQSKFVLTGIAGNPPSIFDAEHGNVTGDSLTFYTRDDRVQVGSNASSRTITRTRTKDESKP